MENRTNAREALIARIRKLLNLARGGSTEDEAAQAMRKAHGLLAAHNLSEAELREAPDSDDRVLDDSSVDGCRDLWTAYVWHASARLHFCGYFYRKEVDGERWIGMRHNVVGRRHNVAVCKLMSKYLVDTVVRLAQEGGAAIHPSERRRFRQSFRLGCAERLVERLEARRAESHGQPTVAPSGTTLPALAGVYDAEARENERLLQSHGISLGTGRPGRHVHAGGRDAGRHAADHIGLDPQISGPRKPARAARDPRQCDLFAGETA